MRHCGIIGLVLAAMLVIGCGKSQEQIAAEKAAEETRAAAEALSKAAQQTAAAATSEGMAAAAKALGGMAGALSGTTPDGKTVEPVSFQALQGALPEVSGWTRAQPTGERMTSPVPFSQAEASYANGDAKIDVKIVDAAFNQLLMAPWSMFLASGYEKQSASGHEKSVSVNGHPGFERWNSRTRSGELNLVVGKRFLVTLEGDNISDMKVLHDVASSLDAGKLTTLQ